MQAVTSALLFQLLLDQQLFLLFSMGVKKATYLQGQASSGSSSICQEVKIILT